MFSWYLKDHVRK
jgi:hypothetical protein